MYLAMRIKLLLCIILLSLCFNKASAEKENLANSNTTSSGDVIKKLKESNNLFIEKIGTYSLTQGECTIVWEIEVRRDKGEKNLTLRTRYPLGVKCAYPFVKQLPLHRRVFNEIFKDWKRSQFSILFLGPLDRLEPANTWNVRIAMASAASPDWKDYRENYPHHKSGKSSNLIFVELANHVDAYSELASLFKEFGLKIKLDSVEKVFVQKAKKMPFYQKLKLQGLQSNPRLMYDAGMSYFSISQFNF